MRGAHDDFLFVDDDLFVLWANLPKGHRQAVCGGGDGCTLRFGLEGAEVSADLLEALHSLSFLRSGGTASVRE